MSFGRLGALGRGFGKLGGGGGSASGSFLLKVDGASFLLLANGTDKIILAGPPAAGGASGTPIGILVSITYP